MSTTRRLLGAFVAPVLPIPAPVYTTGYFEKLLNLLRLYFNRIDKVLTALLGINGGAFINSPYGAFLNNAAQTFAAADTPYTVVLGTTQGSSGMSLASNRVTFELDGLYNVIWNVQLENSDTAAHSATVWLRKNGVDIPNSAFYFTVGPKHGLLNGTADQTANFGFLAVAEDYIEIVIAVTNTALSLYYEAAQVAPYAHPSVPSTYVTVTFITAV